MKNELPETATNLSATPDELPIFYDDGEFEVILLADFNKDADEIDAKYM